MYIINGNIQIRQNSYLVIFGNRFNDIPEKKYFYDIEEKTFFNLGFKDNQYYLWTNQIPLSKDDRETIQHKIFKLGKDKSNFLEIGRFDKQFCSLVKNLPKTKEEYNSAEKQWRLLYKEISDFLTQHHIELNTTRLIE